MTRTIAVTGSASGIGAATMAAIAQRGDHPIGVDRRDADVVGDLSTRDGRRAVAATLEELTEGRLHALVACAGLATLQADQATIVRVNYFGAVDLVEALRPLLARASAPAVAVVASVAMLFDHDDEVVEACLAGDEERAAAAADGGSRAYASSKRALARWVRRTAPAPGWAPEGIRLNAVAPGVVRTPMTALELDDEDRRRELLTAIPQPIGAVGEAEDVAEVLAWLSGVGPRFVTGQVIFVDGGFEAAASGDEIGRLVP